MIEEIRNQIEKNNFRQVSVNVEGIYLYYTIMNNRAYIISLIDYHKGEEFDEEQYRNIIRQIKSNFAGKSFDGIKLLSIVCTREVEKVKNLCGDIDNHWILDESQRRLIIYENQESEFLNVRTIIEEILSVSNPQKEGRGLNSRTPFRYFSICTTIIILINIIIFVIIEWVGSTANTRDMLEFGAMYWPFVIDKKEYYRLFTHMFLHFGISHIVNNMVVLAFLGDKLEHIFGKIKYLIVYFGSGVIAGIASMVYNMLQDNVVVSAGASGAIFGVVGAMLYAVVLNRGKLKDISTRQLIFFVFLSLYGGLTSQGTDNMAHIGGFIGGLLIAFFIYRKPGKEEVQRE